MASESHSLTPHVSEVFRWRPAQNTQMKLDVNRDQLLTKESGG